MLEGILNIDKLPTLDLHGESIDISKIFINDNVKMKNEYIAIIHGKGSGKLKEATKQVLSINKYVLEYKICYFNEGMTLVKLKK
jgi:dsDNA-specific endonuclease/ATPase MutS2